MKSVFLFCTRLYIFLIEIPPMILLAITFSMHDEAPGVFGYYPLEIFLCALILFIMIFFFRAVTITYDEVRMHGLFSSRDKLLIKKGHTLVIGILPKKKLRIEVYGGLGEDKIYDWMADGEGENHEISLFRERAVGNEKTVGKILRYFGVSDEAVENFTAKSGKIFEDEFIEVSVEEKNELFEVRVKFNEIII